MGKDAFDEIIESANEAGSWEGFSQNHIITALEATEDKIDRLRNRLEQAERQRDEARGLLREAQADVRSMNMHFGRHGSTLDERIDAHLRDTGE